MTSHRLRVEVTAGYIVADVERVREPVRRVSEFLLEACGLNV